MGRVDSPAAASQNLLGGKGLSHQSVRPKKRSDAGPLSSTCARTGQHHLKARDKTWRQHLLSRGLGVFCGRFRSALSPQR